MDIRCLSFPIAGALSEHARRRLRLVLRRRSDRIQRVVVRLGFKSGPRCDVDKFCRIQVFLIDAPEAAVEDFGADFYAVVDRATDRVGRVVVKYLDRSARRGRCPTSSHAPQMRTSMKTQRSLQSVAGQASLPDALGITGVLPGAYWLLPAALFLSAAFI